MRKHEITTYNYNELSNEAQKVAYSQYPSILPVFEQDNEYLAGLLTEIGFKLPDGVCFYGSCSAFLVAETYEIYLNKLTQDSNLYEPIQVLINGFFEKYPKSGRLSNVPIWRKKTRHCEAVEHDLENLCDTHPNVCRFLDRKIAIFEDLIKNIFRVLHDANESDREYHHSEEYFAEFCTDNEVQFTENGKVWNY